jgi:hypothetical protein
VSNDGILLSDGLVPLVRSQLGRLGGPCHHQLAAAALALGVPHWLTSCVQPVLLQPTHWDTCGCLHASHRIRCVLSALTTPGIADDSLPQAECSYLASLYSNHSGLR